MTNGEVGIRAKRHKYAIVDTEKYSNFININESKIMIFRYRDVSIRLIKKFLFDQKYSSQKLTHFHPQTSELD
jgi:hypothetical protein